uniref:Uncharacterized protein n=1 Tax=Ciona intestinalis TaxID=7719 RepID=H2XSW4_CIOIN
MLASLLLRSVDMKSGRLRASRRSRTTSLNISLPARLTSSDISVSSASDFLQALWLEMCGKCLVICSCKNIFYIVLPFCTRNVMVLVGSDLNASKPN